MKMKNCMIQCLMRHFTSQGTEYNLFINFEKRMSYLLNTFLIKI